jgi:aspartate aminotransferase-like enzyme
MEAIYRLNHRTFAEEIPQHATRSDGRLVDRFHDSNVYVVYEVDGEIVGMISGRTQRPFSLDQKLGPIDRWLPPHERAVEIRLLAVDAAHRATRVFVRLLHGITRHFVAQGYDLGVLSGTTRQLALYRHLGCVPFASRVGSADAQYQPMYLSLDATVHWPAALAPALPHASGGHTPPRGGNFLPGPVTMSDRVTRALAQPAASHRALPFLAAQRVVQRQLCALTGAAHATCLLGSGTLANDVVAAQLSTLPGIGVVVSNGEFGDRLRDHAARLQVPHRAVTAPWGAELDWRAIQTALAEARAHGGATWLWAVHSETSTGVVNSLEQLTALAREQQARLALDAISSVGALPVSLTDVWMASAVSGKALASYPGVAIVLHQDTPAPSTRIPRYLDLGHAAACGGVPFTQSSNLIAALAASLEDTHWPSRIAQRAHWGHWLRAELEAHGLTVVAPASCASPAVHTIALPANVSASAVGHALREAEWLVSFESDYLRTRNWIQLCVMGEQRAASVRHVASTVAHTVQVLARATS